MTYKDRYYIVKRDLPWDNEFYVLKDRETGNDVNVGSYEKCWQMKLKREGYQEQ